MKKTVIARQGLIFRAADGRAFVLFNISVEPSNPMALYSPNGKNFFALIGGSMFGDASGPEIEERIHVRDPHSGVKSCVIRIDKTLLVGDVEFTHADGDIFDPAGEFIPVPPTGQD